MLQKIDSKKNNIRKTYYQIYNKMTSNFLVEPTDVKEEQTILVFDFETTGLPKDRNAKFIPGHSKTEDFPHAVQLAYILYNKQTGSTKIVNEIIRLPEEVVISKESEAVHHISAEFTRRKTTEGIHFHKEIEDVLREFIIDFRKADIVVAHNIQFDRNILLTELDRLRQKGKEEFVEFLDDFYNNKIEYCTALKGKYICKVEKMDKYGQMYYKMPKLVELYNTLFNVTPNESMLHNAIVDVVICFRCFFKIRYNIDIYKEDPLLHTEIKDIIESLHKEPLVPNVLHKDESNNPEIEKIDNIIDEEEKTADAIVTAVLSQNRQSERLSKRRRKNKGKRSRNRRTNKGIL